MQETPPRFSPLKTVVFSLLPAVLLLCLLEGGSRALEWWKPPLPADYGMGFDPESRVFIPSGPLRRTMTTRPEKEISFQRQSFTLPKPGGVFRVFMLGGSNVNYLHAGLEILADRLSGADPQGRRFEILNMGGLAYGSSRLRRVLDEVVAYSPDLILIYMAHNEFEEMEQETEARPERRALQQAVYRSAFMRRLRDTAGTLQVWLLRMKRMRADLPPEVDWSAAFGHEFSPAEIAERMDTYRENLAAMLDRCREHGVPVAVGTVPSNLWNPDLPASLQAVRDEIQALYARGEFAKGMALARETLRNASRHQASDAENDIIRSLAGERGVPLVDIFSVIAAAEPNGVPGETLLSDRCHLNGPGQLLLLREYERHIRKIAGLPEAPLSMPERLEDL